MADRYKKLAINACDGCKVSMLFKLPYPHKMFDFLHKMNMEHLLQDVSFWQDAQFIFYVQGYNFNGQSFKTEIPVKLNMLHMKRENVMDEILRKFFDLMIVEFVEQPYIVHMEINFPSGI